MAGYITQRILGLAGILLLVEAGFGQVVPFDSDRWLIEAEESRIEDFKGQRSLFIQGGGAVIRDSEFLDGIIEYDVVLPDDRGFTGAVWRWQDWVNYEEFYLRSHQSGNPDANQYTPVFNGLAGWQLYHGPGYGVPVEYVFNEWQHVKLVVSGQQAEVYLEDMAQPLLFIPELKRESLTGLVGISAGFFAPARFANFSYTALDQPPLVGPAPESVETSPGTVTSWQVSNIFDEAALAEKTRLDAGDKASLAWSDLNSESTGITNLARVAVIGEQANTVYARVVVNSEKKQVRQVHFGYSDRVRVYLNDLLLYTGDNTYRSRDYRYLGTIGYFDELYLPLKKGRNELWFAVSESFGGWGIQARFEDLTGITLGK
ncbi:hypothetical protein ACFL6Q_06295 [Candidatus Neomarinimicrobiota bacterium]